MKPPRGPAAPELAGSPAPELEGQLRSASHPDRFSPAAPAGKEPPRPRGERH